MTSPFLLYLECDYQNQKLIIEFSAKILLEDYPQLINKNNFKDCLKKINDLGICQLDIELIYDTAEVVKLDNTEDVHYLGIDSLTHDIKNNISNYNKYVSRLLKNNNFIVEKNVTTKTLKKRLTLYNKSREICRAENQSFLSVLKNKKKLLDHFAHNNLRIELNLNSKNQIRKSLKISDNKISSIFSSTATPIADFINEILADGTTNDLKSLQDYKNMLVLKENDYNLEKVESVLRQYCSPKTHISQVMKPYRELLNKHQGRNQEPVKEVLLNLLHPVSQ